MLEPRDSWEQPPPTGLSLPSAGGPATSAKRLNVRQPSREPHGTSTIPTDRLLKNVPRDPCSFALTFLWQDLSRGSTYFFTKVIIQSVPWWLQQVPVWLGHKHEQKYSMVHHFNFEKLKTFQNIFTTRADPLLGSIRKKFYLAQLESDSELVRQHFCRQSASKSQNTWERKKLRQRNGTRRKGRKQKVHTGTPAPCPQMNDADTIIKSGFVLKSSAVNCSEVISPHIPEKADTEVSNKELMKVENDPDRATEVRQRGCGPRRQQELGWAGTLHRSVVKETSYQARCPPALGSGPSPVFHGPVHSALQRGRRLPILSADSPSQWPPGVMRYPLSQYSHRKAPTVLTQCPSPQTSGLRHSSTSTQSRKRCRVLFPKTEFQTSPISQVSSMLRMK